MAAKSANLYARIEPDVKEKAESKGRFVMDDNTHIRLPRQEFQLPVLLICFINRLFYRGDFHLK